MINSELPIYCDVDGTLIRSDLLIESAFASIKKKPWIVLTFPFWLMRGKSYLKARLAEDYDMEPSLLPYNDALVAYLSGESGRGRDVYLASASEERLISAIADYLGFVRGTIASNKTRNLKGQSKAEEMVRHSGERDFVYIGDSKADLKVWEKAKEGIVVNASSSVERAARSVTTVVQTFPKAKTKWSPYVKAARVHQWLKNMLVFVPLVLSGSWNVPASVIAVVSLFIAFGLLASGTYMLNDLLDLSSDRRHPSKRFRPIASGQVPISHAVVGAILLLVSGLGLASLISWWGLLILCVYLVTTLSYSLYLKTVIVLDVLTLAGLYTLRIIAGAIIINILPSVWLLAFSGFFFLSLALVKRCVELDRISQLGQLSTRGRDYRVSDLNQLSIMGIVSGYIAILVVALYIDSAPATALYGSPMLLWFICPLLVYWISRIWIKVARCEMHDDPLVYSAKDRTSWAVCASLAVVWLLARYISW